MNDMSDNRQKKTRRSKSCATWVIVTMKSEDERKGRRRGKKIPVAQSAIPKAPCAHPFAMDTEDGGWCPDCNRVG